MKRGFSFVSLLKRSRKGIPAVASDKGGFDSRKLQNFGVYSSESVPLVRVESNPGVGQYCFDGKYSFNKYEGDVSISYMIDGNIFNGVHVGIRGDAPSESGNIEVLIK